MTTPYESLQPAVQLRLKKSVIERVRRVAAADQRSMTQMLRILVEEALHAREQGATEAAA